MRLKLVSVFAAAAILAGGSWLAWGGPQTSAAQSGDTLYAGFNEIVWDGATQPILDALAPIAGRYDVVFHWDNAGQRWTAFIPVGSQGIGALQELEQGGIYWFKVREQVLLPN